MISILTADGGKNIAAISILTADGSKDIANASILTPDGSLAFWSGAGGGAFPVTINPDPAYGAVAQLGGPTVTTQPVTASPGGGLAPYSYAWEKLVGSSDWSILAPTAQSTAFRCTGVTPGEDFTANFQVTVTDARGRSSTASVLATVSNYGRLDGVLEP